MFCSIQVGFLQQHIELKIDPELQKPLRVMGQIYHSLRCHNKFSQVFIYVIVTE